MNHSIYSADRETHLRVVVTALVAAIAISGLSLSLHSYGQTAPAESTVVLKAGKPVTVGSSTTAFVR
jgi:hypothetical protein